ncbi:DUF1385 domain-containing protein [Brevibacillus sp. SYP-B805]|uniref:DUF1385 domain-containing protein n=1 Tax=Brevibacillus sp. SYP-B805 TaxID=1578199 RepID=UPI0013EB1AE9|nr:DUF1385 domain-containing protein [Brevibacillus sp. SYP-B805]NGQ97474.1 DUF1385 domain-containing protein [Brevibacillus sp. SYP-B805]
MITGISFGNGVFFHDRKVIACAEVKKGTIHLWAETITLRTMGKMWWRVVLSLPWYYHLFHLMLALFLLGALDMLPIAHIPGLRWLTAVDPLWAVVYLAGFHFVFPARLKKFHGAEHKVFSYPGVKRLEALEEIRRADIVNSGCSTNLVTCFFLPFLLTVPFAPLSGAVVAGAAGFLAGIAAEGYLRRYLPVIYRISAFLQRYVTTKEPDRLHLETAIRSYRLFEHYRSMPAGTK